MRKEKLEKKNHLSTQMASWTSETQNYAVGIWIASTEQQMCYPMCGGGGGRAVLQNWNILGNWFPACICSSFWNIFPYAHLPFARLIFSATADKFELPPLRNSPWCPQFHVSVPCSLPPWHSTYPYNSPHQFKGKCQPTNVSLPLHNELPEAKDYILFSAVDLMSEI